jgi:hypothetical protein
LLRWVLVEWGKCTGRGTRAWIALSLSRFFRRILPMMRYAASATAYYQGSSLFVSDGKE